MELVHTLTLTSTRVFRDSSASHRVTQFTHLQNNKTVLLQFSHTYLKEDDSFLGGIHVQLDVLQCEPSIKVR